MYFRNREFDHFFPSGSVLGEMDVCIIDVVEVSKGFSKTSRKRKKTLTSISKKGKNNSCVWKFEKIQISELKISLRNLTLIFLMLYAAIATHFTISSKFTNSPSNSSLWLQNLQSASISVETGRFESPISLKAQNAIDNFYKEKIEVWKSQTNSKTCESERLPNFLGDVSRAELKSKSRLLIGIGGSFTGQDQMVEKSAWVDEITKLKDILNKFLRLNLTGTDPSNLKDLYLQLKQAVCTNLYEELKPQCNEKGIFSLEFLDYRNVTPLSRWSGVAGRDSNTNELIPLTKRFISRWYQDFPEQGLAIQQMLDIIQKISPLMERELIIKEEFLGTLQTELAQVARILKQNHFFDQSQVCIAKTRHFGFKNPAFTLQAYSNHIPIGGLDFAASANFSEGSFSVGVGKGSFLPGRYGGVVLGADVGWATNLKHANQTFGNYGGFALKFFLGYGVQL